jgi:hypothetical protein
MRQLAVVVFTSLALLIGAAAVGMALTLPMSAHCEDCE